MPFNGSGSFVRLYSWAVDAANSVDISSSRTDAEMNGFAAGLSNCVTRDGQSPPSADLPMGGKKLTNLGNAASDTDALNRITGDGRYLLSASPLPHTVTFDNSGTGVASGTAFDVTASILISYNTIGAAALNASNLFTYSGTSPTLDVPTPNNGTTGGIRIRANATSGKASLQFTDSAAGAEFANVQVTNGNVAFSCTVQAPTATPGDNSTKLATTAYVVTALGSYALLASPTFTGTPTAATAAVGTNTTQLATTAFVAAAKAPNTQSVASAATVTPTFSNDLVDITAQAAGLTLANPTGTAVNGWGIVIRIKDNGTPQTIAYGTQYVAVGTTKPTTTVAGKVLNLGMIFNNNLTRWEIVSVAQE